MRVYNIGGNNEAFKACACGSWLRHWEAFNIRGQKLPVTCAVKFCMNSPEEGAFVQESAGYNRWWVVPLCSFHSHQKSGPLDLVKSVAFASVERCRTRFFQAAGGEALRVAGNELLRKAIHVPFLVARRA